MPKSLKATFGAALVALLLGMTAQSGNQQDLGTGFRAFPPDNPWNWDITSLTVLPNSSTYINSIGAGGGLFPDLSFYYNVVSNGALQTVSITDGSESDPGPGFGSPPGGTSSGSYPVPSNPLIEGGGDAHMLIVDTGRNLLYETYQTASDGLTVTQGSVFDLTSNALRPDGWTSADAAGLPIFPGLLRYEEVQRGDIGHALRFTASGTQNTHLYPARHQAGQANTSLPPMGLRLRLKASVDTSGVSPTARVVLEGLKKYGMFVADNGSSWFISTVIDSRWDVTALKEIGSVHGSDFEAVETVDANGNPILPVGNTTGGGSGGGGGGAGGGVGGAGGSGSQNVSGSGGSSPSSHPCGCGSVDSGQVPITVLLSALVTAVLLIAGQKRLRG